MYLARAHMLVVLVFKLLSFGAGTLDIGQKACSCYILENDSKMTWQQAKDSCKSKKQHLVVMETEKEWKFINNELKNQITGDHKNEWHIGLLLNSTTGNWTWVNGKPLTINKWQSNKPDKGSSYTLIAKEFPPGSHGSFNSIKGDIQRAWICEEETDTCQGVCMHHNPVTTAPLPSTTAATAKITSSTTQDSTDLSDSTTVATIPDVGGRKDDKRDSTVVIVAASLAALLFIALIALAVVFFLKRKRQQPQDAERPKKKAQKQPENPYESINPTEAANLLGTPKSGNARPKTEQSEYAMVNKEKIKQKKGNPVRETNKQAPPEIDHQYAVVNKETKKQKKGEIVYAQIDMGDNDDAEDDTKVHKPAPYEPTVYADVVPTDVINRADPGSKLPTYENVQTTGV